MISCSLLKLSQRSVERLEVFGRGKRVPHFGGVRAAGALDRVRHQPDRGIGDGGDAFGVISRLRLETCEEGLQSRVVALAVEAVDDRHAFGRRAGDVDEFLRIEGLRADDRGGHASRTQLSDKRTGGEEISGRVDGVRVVALDARDDRTELSVLQRIAVLVQDLNAVFRGRRQKTVHRRLAVVVVHRDGRDCLQAERLADIERRRSALRRPEVDEAEDIIAGAGDVGMHAVGRDHHDAGLLEHRRGRAAGGRIAAIDDEFHAVLADQLVGGEDGLVGLGLVVVADQRDLLAEHAASGVDVVDRHLRGDRSRFPVGRGRPGQRGLEADLDVGKGWAQRAKTQRERSREAERDPGPQQSSSFGHGLLP